MSKLDYNDIPNDRDKEGRFVSQDSLLKKGKKEIELEKKLIKEWLDKGNKIKVYNKPFD